MKKVKVLVFSSNEDFARSVLEDIRNSGFEPYLAGRNDTRYLKYSKLPKDVIYFADSEMANFSLDYLNRLIRFIVHNKIDIILPISVPQVLFVSKFIDQFRNVVVEPLIAEFNAIEIVENKRLFTEFCRRHNINQPKTFLINETPPKDIKFPLILKDFEKDTPDKREINNRLELNNLSISDNGVLQESITGVDLDCNVIAKKGKILSCLFQRNYKPEHNLDGGPYCLQAVEPSAQAKMVVSKLIKDLNWSGLAHIDMRETKTGEIFVFELNPRIWVSYRFCYLFGLDIIKTLIEASMGKTEFNTPKLNDNLYLSPRGLLELQNIKLTIKQLGKLKLYYQNVPGAQTDL